MIDPHHNPRYYHYARVHGRTVEEQLDRDKGCAHYYIAWNQEKLRIWSGKGPDERRMSDEDHAAFDAWLEGLPVNFDFTSWPAGELGFVKNSRGDRVKGRIRGTYASGLYSWEALDFSAMRPVEPHEVELITGVQGTLL